MRWRWAWSITGRKPLLESSKIRRNGTSAQEDMLADSIRFFFRVRCTAWRAACTRCSSRRREPVRAGRASAEEGSEVAVDFQAAGLAAAGEARFEKKLTALSAQLSGLSFLFLPLPGKLPS